MYIFISSFLSEGQPARTGHRGNLQGGPLPVINGLITPINGRKSMGNWGNFTLLIGVISPTTGDRAHLVAVLLGMFWSPSD